MILWQVWAFFIPAFDRSHERMLKCFVFLATGLLVAGLVVRLLRRAAGGRDSFLTNYDNAIYNDPDPGDGLHLLRDEGAARDGDRVRAADLRRRADAARVS